MTLVARAALALLILGTLSCSEAKLPTTTAVPVPQKSITSANGSPNIVISQIYPGGGNSGATYNTKYVELLNRGSATVSINGWSLQYASATGTGNFVAKAISGSIAPGKYYLIAVGTGSTGANLPVTPDLTVPSMTPSGSTGKLLLAKIATGIACNGGSNPCTDDQKKLMVDLVGYGGANFYEGAAAAPLLTTVKADMRAGAGCTDTNNNGADFSLANPSPRNGTNPAASCPPLPILPLDHVALSGSSSVMLGATTQLVADPEDENDETVGTATVTWASSDESRVAVDGSGVLTGVALTTLPVTITATAVAAGVTKTASMQVSVINPTIGWIDASTNETTVPAGFQNQLFVTARVSNGGPVVDATFTYEAVDPGIATITDVGNGAIITGVAASATRPTFKITAVAKYGGSTYAFNAHPITIVAAVAAPTDIYGHNDELGDPTPAALSNPNDFLIERPQYTISYNQSRGTPNWVSYEMDRRQFGAEDRCNCFTADPLLPAGAQLFTTNYTGSGFDRGHMTRSADRTVTNGDNAATFFLTNVVPQQADLNQGPWAQLEDSLADSVKIRHRNAYIITGPLYGSTIHYVKQDTGKVAIPDATWKIAIFGNDPDDLTPFTVSSIHTWDDVAQLHVVAVMMPNVSGIRNTPWRTYLTSIDAIEAATGYDFLSLLPQAFQSVLEGTDKPPVAKVGGPYTGSEGASVSFSGVQSTYPAGDDVTFTWSFGDGVTASGSAPTHTYAQDGTFNVTLTITDPYGANATSTTTVTVANVAPQLATIANATILRGETFSASGSFTDPGTDPWTATVNYGDGGGVQPLTLNDHDFDLSHTYAVAGTYTLAVVVNDDDTSDSESAVITVLSPVQGIDQLDNMVKALGGNDDSLNSGLVASLRAKLNAATAQTRQHNNPESVNLLNAFINEVQALVNGGQLDPAVAQPIIDYARRVISSY